MNIQVCGLSHFFVNLDNGKAISIAFSEFNYATPRIMHIEGWPKHIGTNELDLSAEINYSQLAQLLTALSPIVEFETAELGVDGRMIDSSKVNAYSTVGQVIGQCIKLAHDIP